MAGIDRLLGFRNGDMFSLLKITVSGESQVMNRNKIIECLAIFIHLKQYQLSSGCGAAIDG